MPPAAVSLSRIARWLGAVPKDTGTSGSALEKAAALGLPVSDELPDDPDIAFLDLDLAPGQTLPAS